MWTLFARCQKLNCYQGKKHFALREIGQRIPIMQILLTPLQVIKTWKHSQAESMEKKSRTKKQQTPKVLNPAKKFGLQIKPGKNL